MVIIFGGVLDLNQKFEIFSQNYRSKFSTRQQNEVFSGVTFSREIKISDPCTISGIAFETFKLILRQKLVRYTILKIGFKKWQVKVR